MAPSAEKIEEHNWSLVVEPPTLLALVSEMQELAGSRTDSVTVELTVSFSDGFQQGFSNVEDVLSLENPDWCSITGLILLAEGKSGAISCQLGPGWSSPHARVRVVAPERQSVYEGCRRLKERIKSMSRSMPPVVYVTRRLGVFAVVLFVALAAFFLIDSWMSNTRLPLRFLMPSIIVCGLAAYAWICYYLFHPLVFCIGQGARRYERVIKWRWATGTLIAGSILIGGLAMPLLRGWLGIS